MSTRRRRKRRLKRKYRIIRDIYAVIVALSLVIVVGYGISKIFIRPPDIPTEPTDPVLAQNEIEGSVQPNVVDETHERKPDTYTFLLVCPDEGKANADAIMVVTYDVGNQRVGMLSIPRDTLVNTKYHKINASYRRGQEEFQQVVSNLVGFPLDFYVEINLDGFVQLVDAVGGVEFDIPIEMNYSDPAQDLNIFFQPGYQHLTGQQAMEVCRFRKNNDGTGYPFGDIQRGETTRNMMVTVAKKVVSWSSLTKVKQYVEIVSRNIQTDLPYNNLLWFASKGLDLDLNANVGGGSLSGDGNFTYGSTRYCYRLYADESLQTINDLVNPYTTPLTHSDVGFFLP